MTFQDIADSLPNGFHDAELKRFEMDYLQRRLRFDFDIWIGDKVHSEMYRAATVTLDDVAYLVIEPPEASDPGLDTAAICIDTGPGHLRQSGSILPQAPTGTSATWMILHDLNRFLLFGAGSASIEWTGPEENRG